MKIGILGTGMVGQALAPKLVELGHDVLLGTRNVQETLARTGQDHWGNPQFGDWHKQHQDVNVGTFAEAAAHGEWVLNASSGQGSLAALRSAGEKNLNGKVLIDIANPLDLSNGFPPTLSVCNTDSLGEQIQREFPNVKVVKALNTINAHLMIAPKNVAAGEHTLIICGNDAEAKTRVSSFLKEQFGWQDILDLGDISNARGTEMFLPLWVRLWNVTKSPLITVKVVR